MTFDLPIDQVDAARLETLRADGVSEGRQLDYKEVLTGGSDDDKREFLSDVTSFANAAGGDMIFGIREKRDSDNKPTGEIDAVVGLPGLNVDAEKLRLESLIRDGVAPRMPPVSFHPIARSGAAPCLLLRIPRSWAGLHMVMFRNLSRFYARNAAGKYQLDVHEIRAGFVAAETAYERLRRFRAERVAQVLALEAPAPMAEGPKLILHALPLNLVDDVWARFVARADQQNINDLPVIGGSVANFRYNLDGYVLYTMRNDASRQCYTQLFRSGGIEAVSGGVLAKDPQRGGFYPWGMERSIIGALTAYMNFWQMSGVTPPILIGVTLTGVKGWKVLQGFGFPDEGTGYDKDVVMPPEVVMADFTALLDVTLRPVFDFVWNGGGWPGSPNYRDGRWVAPTM